MMKKHFEGRFKEQKKTADVIKKSATEYAASSPSLSHSSFEFQSKQSPRASTTSSVNISPRASISSSGSNGINKPVANNTLNKNGSLNDTCFDEDGEKFLVLRDELKYLEETNNNLIEDIRQSKESNYILIGELDRAHVMSMNSLEELQACQQANAILRQELLRLEQEGSSLATANRQLLNREPKLTAELERHRETQRLLRGKSSELQLSMLENDCVSDDLKRAIKSFAEILEESATLERTPDSPQRTLVRNNRHMKRAMSAEDLLDRDTDSIFSKDSMDNTLRSRVESLPDITKEQPDSNIIEKLKDNEEPFTLRRIQLSPHTSWQV